MRSKAIWIVAALAVCGVVAMAGIALADAAKTKVTIQAQSGGFFGYVHSSRQERCENGRNVGPVQAASATTTACVTDTKIGTDTAQPNGPDSMWSINTDKQGRFYAHVGKKPGCRSDFSRTVHSRAVGKRPRTRRAAEPSRRQALRARTAAQAAAPAFAARR